MFEETPRKKQTGCDNELHTCYTVSSQLQNYILVYTENACMA